MSQKEIFAINSQSNISRHDCPEIWHSNKAWLRQSLHHRTNMTLEHKHGINCVGSEGFDLFWRRGGSWGRYRLHCVCIYCRAVSPWSWREGRAALGLVYVGGRSTTWACSSWDWPRTAQRWRTAEYTWVNPLLWPNTTSGSSWSSSFVLEHWRFQRGLNGVFVPTGGRSDRRDQRWANARHHTHTGYRAHPSRGQ